jgi:pimeloyl-ACP methyl ester carboxylesterase
MDAKGSDILVKVNGINICYDDYGKGSPVVFVHGFPFDKSSWQPQIAALQKNFRVIAYDIRGFGKSTSDQSEFSIEQFADDLVALLDALLLERVTVCGLSMGGYVVLNAVNRYPGRFAKIILADTQCVADTEEGREKRFQAIRQIEEQGLTGYTDAYLKNVFTKSSIENQSPAVDAIRKVILNTPISTFVSSLKALAHRHETCSVLNSIRMPAMIICGKEDIVTPPERSLFLSQNIPHSRLHIIADAAHLSNLEQPEIFNNLLLSFIE